MGVATAKCWGTTECLLELPMIQVHRINFVKGGNCSVHYHNGRYNAFYVLEGRLEIQGWTERGALVVDLLSPGELHVVPPGVKHRFRGNTDGRALEIYFPGEMSTHDIVRLSQGFLDQ